MKHTVIALFDDSESARKAAQSLKARGFDDAAVQVTSDGEPADAEVSISPAVEIESGPLTGLMHRLSALFGVDEPHLAHYEEAVRQGGRLVRVDAADEAQATAARDGLLAAGAVNIDDRVEQWQQAGWREHAARAEAGESAARARAAGVVLHRQEVSIGGVRVYGHVEVVAFDELADDFRAHYEARYAAQGAPYTEFDPAYRYGHALAADPRYEGRGWDEIEPRARSEWEQRHPQSAWEQFKSAAQHAWEQATGR